MKTITLHIKHSIRQFSLYFTSFVGYSRELTCESTIVCITFLIKLASTVFITVSIKRHSKLFKVIRLTCAYAAVTYTGWAIYYVLITANMHSNNNMTET